MLCGLSKKETSKQRALMVSSERTLEKEFNNICLLLLINLKVVEAYFENKFKILTAPGAVPQKSCAWKARI